MTHDLFHIPIRNLRSAVDDFADLPIVTLKDRIRQLKHIFHVRYCHDIRNILPRRRVNESQCREWRRTTPQPDVNLVVFLVRVRIVIAYQPTRKGSLEIMNRHNHHEPDTIVLFVSLDHQPILRLIPIRFRIYPESLPTFDTHPSPPALFLENRETA